MSKRVSLIVDYCMSTIYNTELHKSVVIFFPGHAVMSRMLGIYRYVNNERRNIVTIVCVLFFILHKIDLTMRYVVPP